MRLYQGWEAVRLESGKDHAELTARRRGTGELRTFRARYLIGADGANSFVRQAAGIEWTDLGYRSRQLVIDYRPHDPEVRIENLPDLAMVCDPARPAFLMRRLGWKHARWEFALLPGETPQEMEDPQRAWELLAPWVKPADGELIRHVVYPFQALLAGDWRRGRVLLIGDAAHVMPPVTGQGVCSGIRDAKTLAVETRPDPARSRRRWPPGHLRCRAEPARGRPDQHGGRAEQDVGDHRSRRGGQA